MRRRETPACDATPCPIDRISPSPIGEYRSVENHARCLSVEKKPYRVDHFGLEPTCSQKKKLSSNFRWYFGIRAVPNTRYRILQMGLIRHPSGNSQATVSTPKEGVI